MSDHRESAFEPCWAGRKAFLGGRWMIPCDRSMLPTHVITDPDTPGAPEIKLCDYHYTWLMEDAPGLVTEPNPTPERIQVYEEKRH